MKEDGSTPSAGSGDTAFLLFSGTNQRAVVAFCRALKSHGATTHIVARTASDPIFRTRYRAHVRAVRREDRLDLDDLLQCVEKARAATGVKRFVVYPSSEFLNTFLLEHRTTLSGLGCELPLPPAATYARLSNKEPFSQLCREAGLSTPRRLEGGLPETVPCVAKPKRNVGPSGTLYPHLLRTQADLRTFSARERAEDYYFEEYVAGGSYYLLFHVARDGAVVRASQHNLAQQPGGKSIVLARSAEVHELPIADAVERLLRENGFFGLSMVELRRRPNGEFVVIEQNPRAWGPLQLVLDSGSTILSAFICDWLGEAAPRPGPPRTGTRYLWLGGLVQAWRSGQGVSWHESSPDRRLGAVVGALTRDVYLRRDTLGWFAREIGESLRRTS